MKLRYFVVDGAGVLRRVSRADVAGLWEGARSAEDLGARGTCDLRLITVLCDANLNPSKLYLLRLPLTRGRFTAEDYLTLRIFTCRDCVTRREVEEHHGAGWPSDLGRQLAVALDVPLDSLAVPLRVGGPLFVAAARGVSPQEAVRFLR
jgi:hypothetical protein